MDDRDSDFFNTIGADEFKHSGGGDECILVYRKSELLKMSHEQLLEHALILQDAYVRLERENSLNAWETREFNNNLTYFSQVAKLANQLNAATIETISNIVANDLPSYFNCSRAILFLYDAETEMLTLHASTGPCPKSLPLNRVINGDHFIFQLLFHRVDPYMTEYHPESGSIIPDDQADAMLPVPPEWVELFSNRAIIFPLTMRTSGDGEHSDMPLGGIIIGYPNARFEPKDVDLSFIFNNLISTSLYNAMLLSKLNEMTIIDSLTHLYNRRHLITLLSSSMAQAKRQRHDLSIAMLDIDHFKRFNDTFGHICGDEVLRQVGERLKLSIRNEVDIPARYGGEEFVAIMPFTSMDQAVKVAERIRANIENRPFTWERHQFAVTGSLGVAEYLDGETVEQFIDRADRALYKAKNGGRNRVSDAPNAKVSTQLRMRKNSSIKENVIDNRIDA
ncbi:MAG: GGDEF domain-containing protein [Planctomycetota bacterium]|nr:GGDEF domain-containing protein [Planctomycetota bacterium]